MRTDTVRARILLRSYSRFSDDPDGSRLFSNLEPAAQEAALEGFPPLAEQEVPILAAALVPEGRIVVTTRRILLHYGGSYSSLLSGEVASTKVDMEAVYRRQLPHKRDWKWMKLTFSNGGELRLTLAADASLFGFINCMDWIFRCRYLHPDYPPELEPSPFSES
jgi:hypothetical protein